jgi:hypothetical protein
MTAQDLNRIMKILVGEGRQEEQTVVAVISIRMASLTVMIARPVTAMMMAGVKVLILEPLRAIPHTLKMKVTTSGGHCHLARVLTVTIQVDIRILSQELIAMEMGNTFFRKQTSAIPAIALTAALMVLSR